MLLDANILLLPVRTGFPLEQEIDRLVPGAELAVPRSVLAEIDRLAERGVAGARAARALAGRYPAVRTEGRGDDAIVRVAVAGRLPVVTADRHLQTRLSAQGVAVLAPRDRHRLELHAPRTRRPSPRTRSG